MKTNWTETAKTLEVYDDIFTTEMHRGMYRVYFTYAPKIWFMHWDKNTAIGKLLKYTLYAGTYAMRAENAEKEVQSGAGIPTHAIPKQ